MGIKRVITKYDLGTKKPFGWGLAYWDYSIMEGYLYPIPINYIVWFFRETYFKLTETPKGIKEKAWAEGYQAGVSDTWDIREEEVEKRVYKKIRRDMIQELLQDYLGELTKIWCDDD